MDSSAAQLKWRSEAMTGSSLKKDDLWLKRSAARAFFRAVGWRDEDFAKVRFIFLYILLKFKEPIFISMFLLLFSNVLIISFAQPVIAVACPSSETYSPCNAHFEEVFYLVCISLF